MADNTPKIYVKCSAKELVLPSGHIKIRLGLKAEEFSQFLLDHVNDRGYVNLIVEKRREVGKFGDTHTVTLDTWQPTHKPAVTPATQEITDDDIPF